MTNAEHYVVLINEIVSIKVHNALNDSNDLIDLAEVFSERAARILADQPVGTIGQFLTEVDAIREAQRKEEEEN